MPVFRRPERPFALMLVGGIIRDCRAGFLFVGVAALVDAAGRHTQEESFAGAWNQASGVPMSRETMASGRDR
jgi:hypothetical protein